MPWLRVASRAVCTQHKVALHSSHRQWQKFPEEMEITKATIGSDPWKNASIRNIRLSKSRLESNTYPWHNLFSYTKIYKES